MINSFVLFLMVSGTCVGAIGALMIKKGLIYYNSLRSVYKNYRLAIGFFCYGISFLPYLWALKLENLSIIFPLASLSYLWVTFFSVLFLHEKMNKWKWLALNGIILGIVLIGIGS
jgi:uncharacterized membrane protein